MLERVRFARRTRQIEPKAFPGADSAVREKARLGSAAPKNLKLWPSLGVTPRWNPGAEKPGKHAIDFASIQEMTISVKYSF